MHRLKEKTPAFCGARMAEAERPGKTVREV